MRLATLKPEGWHVAWNEASRSVWTEVLEGIKAIKGRQWIAKSKMWLIPAEQEKALEILGFELARPTGAIAEPELDLASIELNPTKIHPKMFPLQVDWLRMLVANQGRAINTDEPGAGKTVMALGALSYFADFPALIVTTAPTKMQWARQFSKWCKGEAIQVLEGQSPTMGLRPVTTVINWEILHHWAGTMVQDARGYERFLYDGVLSKIEWKCIIMDEFHKHIGNPSSIRAKVCKSMTRRIPHIQPLSGTPIRSRPEQFFPILNMVRPEEFTDLRRFQNRYCGPKSNGFGLTYKGATNIEELHSRIKPFMLRRTMDVLQPDMPPMLPVVVPLEINKNIRNPLHDPRRSAFDLKRDSLVAWVEDFLEAGEPLLVFAYHRAVVEWLCEKLKSHNPVKIYGGQSSKEREHCISQFTGKKTSLAIANIEAAGTGVDGLQAVCRSVFFAEYADTPTDMEQAAKRLHRTGQKNCVNAYYSVAQGVAFDEDRAAILDERNNVMSKLVNGEAMDDEDFLSLLMKRRLQKGI